MPGSDMGPGPVRVPATAPSRSSVTVAPAIALAMSNVGRKLLVILSELLDPLSLAASKSGALGGPTVINGDGSVATLSRVRFSSISAIDRAHMARHLACPQSSSREGIAGGVSRGCRDVERGTVPDELLLLEEVRSGQALRYGPA